ncbi:hypothetical protein [Hymenobacter sp. 102]|uniref:hypothetical protein n=1 Tax=Hymenobacter sp. 102 TaxID=3403152 RepID=UPI003CE7184C
MLRTLSLIGLITLGSQWARAQLLTEASQATAARDSLLQVAAATRLELAQQTSFVLKASNKRRSHVVRGYRYSTDTNSSEYKKRKVLVWQQRTIYRRNGRVQEKYTAYLHDRRILDERWLNDRPLWIRLNRPQDLKTSSSKSSQPGFAGLYVASGFLSWNAKKYLLPTALHPVAK